jgi:hypothetical protein
MSHFSSYNLKSEVILAEAPLRNFGGLKLAPCYFAANWRSTNGRIPPLR